MLRKTPLFLLTGILSLSSFSLGNGGGYLSPQGGGGGNVLPFVLEGVSQVAMEEEDLVIELWNSYAHINVKYKLRNTTDAPIHVRFGFPVEAPNEEKQRGMVLLERQQQKNPVQTYKATLNGKPLPAELQRQAQALEEDNISGLRLYGWFVSTMELQAHEQAELSIEADVNHIDDGGYANNDLNTDVTRTMVYRLSTAAVWNGPIKNGNITVKARSIDAEDIVFKEPVNRFKRSGNSWTWKFKNLEPTLKDDMIVQVAPVVEMYATDQEEESDQPQGSYYKRQGKYYHEYPIKSDMLAVVSSGQKKDTGNFILQQNSQISIDEWRTGNITPDKEESLTLTLPKPVRLGAISLASESIEGNDCTVETMQIIANNGAWSRPVRFQPGTKFPIRWISLEGCPEKISTLKLLIKSISPSSRHLNKAEISDVTLYEKISKPPRIHPCR